MAVHISANATNIDIDRAEANASAASHTLNSGVIFIDIVFEFVHKSLTDPVQLGIPGVVTGTMQGKKRVHAAVPIAHATATISAVFILNVETPAGRTHIGAGAAVNTGKRNLFPERGAV